MCVDAVQLDLYQETEIRNMVPFQGQPLMLLLTLHDKGDIRMYVCMHACVYV